MINIENFLEKYYKKDDKIILACSTGPDSMFLLYKILESKYKNDLIVCYFNHKLRKEAEEEENFIKNLGKENGFQIETYSEDINLLKENNVSKSLEEIARERRYLFLNKIKEKYNSKYIITAHHLDDKIETFFFNLARGSKLSGLINMEENSGIILRPLLKIKKSDILAFLEENNLDFKIDKTNFDIEITRNYLRYEIIPKFGKINKNYKENISKTLDYFADLKSFLDGEIKNFLNNYDYIEGKRFFILEDFNDLNLFLKKEIIRYIYFLSNGNSTIGLSEANIAEILKFINGKNNKTIKNIKNLAMIKDNKIIFY